MLLQSCGSCEHLFGRLVDFRAGGGGIIFIYIRTALVYKTQTTIIVERYDTYGQIDPTAKKKRCGGTVVYSSTNIIVVFRLFVVTDSSR